MITVCITFGAVVAAAQKLCILVVKQHSANSMLHMIGNLDLVLIRNVNRSINQQYQEDESNAVFKL